MTTIEANGHKRPNFEMNIDTRAIFDRLKQVPIGGSITYDALSALLGRPVSGGTPTLQSALRALERDGCVFANIRGQGYQRLDDVSIVKASEHDRLLIRRKARRAVERLTSVQNFEALPNDMKVKHNAAMSGFGAIVSIMHPSKMKTLEEKVEAAQAKLPLAKTLAAFSE